MAGVASGDAFLTARPHWDHRGGIGCMQVGVRLRSPGVPPPPPPVVLRQSCHGLCAGGKGYI